jgi:hypothetical protein
MNTLLSYANYQYSVQAIETIIDVYVDNYPYLSGYGVAVMLSDLHSKRVGVSPGLLSKVINEGYIRREAD